MTREQMIEELADLIARETGDEAAAEILLGATWIELGIAIRKKLRRPDQYTGFFKNAKTG